MFESQMDVSGEASPTKDLSLAEILERVEIIGITWPEETASTRAQ